MVSVSTTNDDGSSPRPTGLAALRWLASLKWAVGLLVVIAVVLAVATFLESSKGEKYTRWYVYDRLWFAALLALLGVSILAATLVRLPWKWKHTGFLTAHFGVLVLLVGAIQSQWAGIDGWLRITEEEKSDTFLLPHRTQVTIVGEGPNALPRTGFAFSPGPVDWGPDDALDCGQIDGVAVRILEFYQSADVRREWVADRSRPGVPAVRLSLVGPRGELVPPRWCVARSSGTGMDVDPEFFELHQAPADSMVEDFLDPPDENLGEKGLLSAHYGGQTCQIAVDEKLGQRIPLGDSGVAVTLIEYDPNPVPRDDAHASAPAAPENPMLLVTVHLPDRSESIPQLVSARYPLEIHRWQRGSARPVKFWYHHAAVSARLGVQFLQTPNEKLYCRRGTGRGMYTSHGEVRVGDRVEITPGYEVRILNHFPQAQPKVTYVPWKPAEGKGPKLEAAARVEVTVGETKHDVWLWRNRKADRFVTIPTREGPIELFETIQTAEGPLRVALGYERRPLGFTLELLDFKRGMNPGRRGDASFASKVRVIDESGSSEHEISMNRPLDCGRFTLYQSGFEEYPGELDVSAFTVARDPGRLAKYAGSVMVCVGIFIVYYLKGLVRFLLWVGTLLQVRNGVVALTVSLALGTAARAEDRPSNAVDWGPWRGLPVLADGRRKPLETLARETLRTLGHATSFPDPETGESLNPTALYLTMLFDYERRDEAPDPHATVGMGVHERYYDGRQPDKWDRAALLWVELPALREALGMPKGRERISPWELGEAQLRRPQTPGEISFREWGLKLLRKNARGLPPFEKGARELAGHLLTYQAHRMGEELYVLPRKGSEQQDWISVAGLLTLPLDDRSDPDGHVRRTKKRLEKAREAYRAGSAEDFHQAAAAFLAMAKEVGPRLGVYPSEGAIDLELAYNRWAPFRIAWWCTLAAFVCMVAWPLTRLSLFSVAGPVALGAGLLAMTLGFWARMAISGWAPVTNFYESVVFMCWGAAAFGFVRMAFSGRAYVLTSAAAVATIGLMVADLCPNAIDSSIQPLQPVLRSNFWLAVHVTTIMLGYSAFAEALAIGNITLGYCLIAPGRKEAIKAQSRDTYASLQLGVFLLAVGTVLGAMWADDSWGRFWGWDPKEVWALVSLLCYLAVLHARCAGWVGPCGLAAWSVICFAMIIMAWYGVNLLRSGMHNYGFVTGQATYYLFSILFAEVAFAAAATARYVLDGGPAQSQGLPQGAH
ncbi:MAG: cytochrome c biogenesis protein [Planctomycetota bacterium]|jgi:ABC-type transport system involved in cytochrome c biogenesis permease subunit